LTGRNFTIPTESQWEYAAIGGQYNFGDYGGGAWYKDNSDATTHEVGGKDSNNLGLYDVCGNVREWCDGWDGSRRALRGGGWYNGEDEATVTSRYYDDPEVRDNNYGFRICLDI
jgi:formylglycine-generating enzyme required for sulfatase activity